MMRAPIVDEDFGHDLPDHLGTHLRDWVHEDLITAAEADLIASFETSRVPLRKVPLAAEVVGYLGAVLVLAAGAVVYGNRFEQLSGAWQVAVPALAAVAALGAGIPLVRNAEPTFRRLGGVLWTMSVGLFAFAFALALADTTIQNEHVSLPVSACTLVYAAVLYGLTRHGGLQAAMLAAAVGTGVGALLWAGATDPADAGAAYAIVLLGIGLAWAAGGALGRLEPAAEALLLGSGLALFAPTFLMEGSMGFGLLLGIVIAAGLLTVATWAKSTLTLLLAGVALFGYLVGAISRYLADSLGAPVALALSGLVLIGVAIVVSRLRRFSRERPQPASAGADRS